MVHGGLRYLLYDVPTTRHSSEDAGRIRRIAPHVTWRIPFLWPLFPGKRFFTEATEAFLSAYDPHARRKGGLQHARLSAQEARALEPGLAEDVNGALTLDEWGCDVFRLAALNALDARECGADVYTHSEVVELLLTGSTVRGLRVRDRLNGQERSVEARLVVNAAGPWAGTVAEMANASVAMRPGKGVHVTFERRIGNYGLILEGVDGRVLFLVPHGAETIVGTTDTDYYGDPVHADLDIHRDEVAYVIEAAARALPQARSWRPVRAWAGVRNTLFEWGVDSDDLSRRHEVLDHATRDRIDGLISVVGGKLAAFRQQSEEAVDLALRKLGKPHVACVTGVTPLPGGGNEPDFAALSATRSAPAVLERVWRRVGDRIIPVFAGAGPAGTPVCRSEGLRWPKSGTRFASSGAVRWRICAGTRTWAPVLAMERIAPRRPHTRWPRCSPGRRRARAARSKASSMNAGTTVDLSFRQDAGAGGDAARRCRIRIMTVISDSALNQRTTADQFFRLITDGLTDYSIVLLDADGFIVSWPRSAQMIEGYSAEDVLGEHVTMFWPMEDRAYVNQILREASALGRSEIESWVLRENGDRYWADVVFSATRDDTGEITGFIRVLRDQTERRRAEEAMIARTQELNERRQLEQKLRQAQKMEAVGRLAGGIAHDFNNLLTAIRGNAELLLNDFPLDGGVRSNVEEINHAADRAAALTRQLLAFSRRQFLQPSVLNLDSVLAETAAVVRGITGDDIKVITRTAGNGAYLRADRGQLEQVLMNLAINARDAMPQGGTLTLESGTAELDEEFVRVHPGAQTGSFVRLSVTDTGQGMDAPTMSHVFEPFFTTKAVGQGTGLGLATVYGIVKQSEGYIEVQSKAGAGTRFDIYLPRVWQDGEARRNAAAQANEAPTEHTVLLVEDEDGVRAPHRASCANTGTGAGGARRHRCAERGSRLQRPHLDPSH
jgi:glycerol-3-phosphate dehydrogenase